MYRSTSGKIEMVAFPFIFFWSAAAEPKIIYISNLTEIRKEYTEGSAALARVLGRGHKKAFRNLYPTADTKKNKINYTQAKFIFRISFLKF